MLLNTPGRYCDSVDLIDNLTREHLLIEKVAGSLQTFARKRAAGLAGAEDGHLFMRFFKDYSGHFHHGREEDVLVPLLVREAELPEHRGPIPAILGQHEEMARTLGILEPLLIEPALSGEARNLMLKLALEYSRSLWQHIDAENSVLLPESRERLAWAGLKSVPDREETEDEAAARFAGEQMVEAYPPATDSEAIRGEGCVICPSYGVSCEGIEREWWTDSEWESFPGRSG